MVIVRFCSEPSLALDDVLYAIKNSIDKSKSEFMLDTHTHTHRWLAWERDLLTVVRVMVAFGSTWCNLQ